MKDAIKKKLLSFIKKEKIKGLENQGEYKSYTDVYMFRTKNKAIQKIIKIDKGKGELPELRYDNQGSKFSLEFIKPIIDLIESVEGKEASIKLRVNEDYPLTIESEKFEFIIAPRVKND